MKEAPIAAGPLEASVRALPCPFCGSLNIEICDGSTFRWVYAGCGDCGAQAGEVRRQTMGKGTTEEWQKKAEDDAIAEWNRRSNLEGNRPR